MAAMLAGAYGARFFCAAMEHPGHAQVSTFLMRFVWPGERIREPKSSAKTLKNESLKKKDGISWKNSRTKIS